MPGGMVIGGNATALKSICDKQGMKYEPSLGGCVPKESTETGLPNVNDPNYVGTKDTRCPPGSEFWSDQNGMRTGCRPIGGTGGGGGSTGSGGGGYGSGGGGGSTNPLTAEIERLIAEIRGGTQPNVHPQLPGIVDGGPNGYDPAATRASYARAKERTGLAAQSAMRSLRESMGQRGISGSGIEAEMTGRIHEAGLGELADHDRGMAEAEAGRAFQAGQSRIDRLINQYQFNANLQNNSQQQTWQNNLSKWSLLAQLMRG